MFDRVYSGFKSTLRILAVMMLMLLFMATLMGWVAIMMVTITYFHPHRESFRLGSVVRLIDGEFPATDGHRFCLVDRENQKIRGIEEKGIIIPQKGVLEIKKIIGDRYGKREMGIYPVW